MKILAILLAVLVFAGCKVVHQEQQCGPDGKLYRKVRDGIWIDAKINCLANPVEVTGTVEVQP